MWKLIARRSIAPVAMLFSLLMMQSFSSSGISVDAPVSGVASYYEQSIDYFYNYPPSQYPGSNRTLTDIIAMLKETHTKILFRSFFTRPGRLWRSTDGRRTELEEYGEAIRRIKDAIPGMHMMGGISCRLIRPGPQDLLWPGNGSAVTEEQYRRMIWILPNGTIPSAGTEGAAPLYLNLDIMKPEARDFIVEWTKLQVDAGVDSVYFDEPEVVAMRKKSLGLLTDVSDYYIYWKDIVERVKGYAKNQYGRELLVTANSNRVAKSGEVTKTPPPWPFQDFLHVSFREEDFTTLSIQDDWTSYKRLVRDTYDHDIPILAFLDFGFGSTSPLPRLARLSVMNQIQMLRRLNQSCKENGVVFVYPMHGGYVWLDNMMKYDCIAAGTYDAIRELALSIQETTTSSSSIRTTSTPTQTTQSGPSPTIDVTTVYTFTGLVVIIGVALFASIYRKKKRHCYETSVKKGFGLLRQVVEQD
jgi:hypothetical protein